MRAMKLAVLTLAISLSLIGTARANASDASDFNEVPEPGSMALLLTGIGVGAALFFRRRN